MKQDVTRRGPMAQRFFQCSLFVDSSATGHLHALLLIRMATGLSLKCTALQGMDRYVLHGFEMINFPVRGGAPAGRCSQDSSATGHCVERRKTSYVSHVPSLRAAVQSSSPERYSVPFDMLIRCCLRQVSASG